MGDIYYPIKIVYYPYYDPINKKKNYNNIALIKTDRHSIQKLKRNLFAKIKRRTI